MNPAGRALSGSADGAIRQWDVGTGTELWAVAEPWPINALAVGAVGNLAVSGCHDGSVSVWGLDEGRKLSSSATQGEHVHSVCVMPDGGQALCGLVHDIVAYDLHSGEKAKALGSHMWWVQALAVTASGRWAVSGSRDRTVKIWDMEAGQEMHMLVGQWAVNAVAVTSDERRALSASSDGTVTVWDLHEGTELATLKGDWPVNALALAPDDRRAVTGSNDGKLRVWDLESAAEEAVLVGHGEPVNAVSLSPDGRWAVSGSDDHSLKVWDLDNASEVASMAVGSRVSACAWVA